MANELITLAGSPRMVRSGTVNTGTASFFFDVEIPSYQNFTELLAIDDGSDTKVYLEGDVSGTLTFGFPTGNTIWTDGYTGRFRLVVILGPDGGGGSLGKIFYRRMPTGVITAGPVVNNAVTTPNRTAYAGSPLFLTDMNGTLRFHRLLSSNDFWGIGEAFYLLENGIDTGQEARKYRATFFNDCSDPRFLHLDQSYTGGDFTPTGTILPLPADPPASVFAIMAEAASDGAAAPVVPPLSWAPTLSAGAAPIAAAAMISAIFAPVLTPTAAAAPPLSWAPVLATQAPAPPPLVRSAAFAPIAPLVAPLLPSWAPSFTAPFIAPAPPGFSALVQPLLPLASNSVTPLSWAAELAGPPLFPVVQLGSRSFAPVAPVAASTVPPLSWAPTLAKPVLPPLPALSSATYRPLVAPVSYALACHSSGRYHTYNGSPFQIRGDTAFGAAFKLSLVNLATYLDARKLEGFNSVFFALTARFVVAGDGTADAQGHEPFLLNVSGGTYTGVSGTADFATPSDAYFTYLKSCLDLAESKGFVIVCYIYPFGFGGDGTEGLYPDLTLSQNTLTVCNALGQYIANGHGTFGGFKSNQNILWVVGSDYGQVSSVPPSSTAENKALEILKGMQQAGALQLVTGDWQAPSLGTDEPIFTNYISSQGVYTYGGVSGDALNDNTDTYRESRLGYNYTPVSATQGQTGSPPLRLPAWLKETTYLHSPNHDPTAGGVRKYMYWAWLSGCTAGLFYGNENVWPFANGTWQTAITDDGDQHIGLLYRFQSALRAWHLLVPSELDGMRRLIPSSAGTQTGSPSNYVAAAQASDGSIMLAFVPKSGTGSQTFTVDLRSMAGNARARWWDPTSGTYNNTSGGATSGQHSLANTLSAQSFTTPGTNAAGDNDWVLILDTLEPLSWLPRVDRTTQDIPQPVRSTMLEPVQVPAAAAVTPLSWAPRLSPPVAPAPGPMSSSTFAPVAPLATPALSWDPTLAPGLVPPPPALPSQLFAPVAPLAVPPLAWQAELSPVAPAAPPAIASSQAAPVQVPTAAVPALSWAPTLSPLVVPPAQPVSSARFAPIAPLTVAPLSWLGFTEPPAVPPPPAIPSSVVAPVTPALPVPALSWLPHVTAPYFAPPAAAGQVMVQPLVPIASAVVTPLSWAPNTSAPPLPPIAGPLSLRFGPVAPLTVPALSWAPALAPPPPPASPPVASSQAAPVLPPAPAVTPLAWGPARGQAVVPPAPTDTPRAAAPPLPPATPTGWMLGSEVATVYPAAALLDLARVFEPVVTPTVPPGAWSGAGTAPGIAGTSAISMEVGPLTVPAPQVPPPLTLQPVGVQVPEAGVATPPQSTVAIEQPKGATPVAGIGGGPTRARIRKV